MAAPFWRLVEILLMIDDNPVAMRKWRLLVAMALLFLIVQVCASYGMLRFIGVEGFVKNSELTAISQRLETAAGQTAEIKSRLLEQAIIAARVQQCTATSKRYFTDHLRELMDEYYYTNKRPFDLPTCEALN
jgi:hypothetical protein